MKHSHRFVVCPLFVLFVLFADISQALRSDRGSVDQPRSKPQPHAGAGRQVPLPVEGSSGTGTRIYDAEFTLEKLEPGSTTAVVTLNPAAHTRLQEDQMRQFANLKLSVVVTSREHKTGRTYTKHATTPLTRQFQLPLAHTCEPGHHYTFTLRVKKSVNDQHTFLFKKTLEHKEVFAKSQLQELMKKAEDHTKWRLPVTFAYRNKPNPYFQNILQNRGSIMEVYIKDENGDPGCPINGQIKGLFFAVRPDPKTKQLPADSYFGEKRIYLPVGDLFKPHLNMYFADFWCHNQKAHHVTLVVTTPNSTTDRFCSKTLLKISQTNNPFFFHEEGRGYFCCIVPEVEILYTENVDLRAPNIGWADVTALGRGSSLPGGIPKNVDCDICNLH